MGADSHTHKNDHVHQILRNALHNEILELAKIYYQTGFSAENDMFVVRERYVKSLTSGACKYEGFAIGLYGRKKTIHFDVCMR